MSSSSPSSVTKNVGHGHSPLQPSKTSSDGLGRPLLKDVRPNDFGMSLMHLMILEGVFGSPFLGVGGQPDLSRPSEKGGRPGPKTGVIIGGQSKKPKGGGGGGPPL